MCVLVLVLYRNDCICWGEWISIACGAIVNSSSFLVLREWTHGAWTPCERKEEVPLAHCHIFRYGNGSPLVHHLTSGLTGRSAEVSCYWTKAIFTSIQRNFDRGWQRMIVLSPANLYNFHARSTHKVCEVFWHTWFWVYTRILCVWQTAPPLNPGDSFLCGGLMRHHPKLHEAVERFIIKRCKCVNICI